MEVGAAIGPLRPIKQLGNQHAPTQALSARQESGVAAHRSG